MLIILVFGGGVLAGSLLEDHPDTLVSPVIDAVSRDTSLDEYAIESLASRTFTGSTIVLDDAVATTSAYTAYRFHFDVDGKRATGLAHVPSASTSAGPHPVIVQFRGYVDPQIYESGIGTAPSARVFAENGYITLAPDFLGYGDSDMPSEDVFAERFQTYLVALELLASVDSLSQADPARVGIWGHSNGGHIALAVLEIVGDSPSRVVGLKTNILPTTLWAPVTAPFPYSILYFTNEFEDGGKLLRKELARFEKDYDVDRYTITEYFDRIASPVQIHQGGRDDAVPMEWSDAFVETMDRLDRDVTYHTYPDADHNMAPAWNTVVSRDLNFFAEHLSLSSE